jgi:tetratricopeptide (TPR) repeat protein
MQFDPENSIVKLCAAGMNAEATGNSEEALQLFQQAWDTAGNDFEAFIAAHYMARHQDPVNSLQWNMEALNRALLVPDENIRTYYPSLYLNIGKSYELLDDAKAAAKYYHLAADASAFLPAGKYAEMIKTGIHEGLKRANTFRFKNEMIDKLIDGWCERKELRPLSIVLPAYLGNLGTEEDMNKLISALSYLNATKCLIASEQQMTEQLIDLFRIA